MKYLCHVPIESYGFISVEIEGTADDAVEAYNTVSHAKAGGTGIPSREFCSLMDYYVSNGKMPEDGVVKWEGMSNEQRLIIHEIKKCFSRINKSNK